MKYGAHATAPHGLAPLPAHLGVSLSRLNICIVAFVAAAVASGDLPVMYIIDINQSSRPNRAANDVFPANLGASGVAPPSPTRGECDRVRV